MNQATCHSSAVISKLPIAQKRLTWHLCLGGVLAAMFVWPGLAGQEAEGPDVALSLKGLSLEDLSSLQVDTVYGASKHEQAVSEAPSSVTLITQDDIKMYGYRTLGDLLRSVRGFYVSYDRSYNFIGVRGVDRPGDFGGRVLINIDGHRMNDPIYDSAFSDTDFLLDLALVDHVEIIRGAGSSLYGNNAFFAVINVVTRRGAGVGGVEASGTAGSYDAYTGRLSYGNKFTNGVELLVSGTYLNSAGHERLYFPEYSSVNHGVAENLDGSEVGSAFASISYQDLSFEGGVVDRRKHAPTAQYGTVFNDPRFLNEDERAFGELKYAHTFGDGWLVQARAYYDQYAYNGTYPFNHLAPVPGPVTLNLEGDQAQWAGSEVSVSKTLWERQRLTVGGECRDDLQLKLSNSDVAPPLTYVNSQRDASSFAFYAQDELKLFTNLTLNAGVRYDHFNTFGGTVNPRSALIYNPWHDGTFKFIYGQAFRAPNEYETSYIQPAYKANPNLKPETIRSYELVYEQGLPGRLRLSGSVFLEQIKGLIGQTVDPVDGLNYFANLAQVESRGFETELEGRWAGGLRARLSYTYAEARDTLTGNILDNSPRHLGKANLVVPLWHEKVFAGLEVQAMSGRTTVQGNRIGAFWLANLTLYSRELIKHVEFSASLYNLFNEQYSDPTSSDYLIDKVPQDGRAYQVKVTWRF